MGRALIFSGLLSLLTLAVAFIGGLLHGWGLIGIQLHIILSVPAGLLVLFTQVMVVMYFGGTGYQIRKAVRAGEDLKEELKKSRALRRAVSPWAWGSLILVMAAIILAGGVHTGVLPDFIHWGLAALGLFATLVAVYREILCIDENERLMNEHEEILARY